MSGRFPGSQPPPPPPPPPSAVQLRANQIKQAKDRKRLKKDAKRLAKQQQRRDR